MQFAHQTRGPTSSLIAMPNYLLAYMSVYACVCVPFNNPEWRVIVVLRDVGGGTSGGWKVYYQGNKNKLSNRLRCRFPDSVIYRHSLLHRYYPSLSIVICVIIVMI